MLYKGKLIRILNIQKLKTTLKTPPLGISSFHSYLKKKKNFGKVPEQQIYLQLMLVTEAETVQKGDRGCRQSSTSSRTSLEGKPHAFQAEW